MSLRVREATPEDTEAIVSVTAEGWRTGYREIVAAEHLADLPIERWRHEVSVGLRRPVADAFTLVAELDGRFTGYLYVAAPSRDADLVSEVAELVAIYVEPRLWGGGAGAALMLAGLERVAELGYTEVVLWTFKKNERAISFYERRGWAADGAEKLHTRAQAAAVRYRRRIGRPGRPPQ
ncbi:MAG: GNAT family N-acetyltransferase [Solirubrobacterales bacterium]